MSWMQRAMILIFAMSSVASCAHFPRSPNADADIATFRDQYLSLHPNGEYNERIVRGELARGMGGLEVLASWGVPHMRRRDHKDETWSYYSEDKHTSDFLIYELEFDNDKLERWALARTTAAAGGVVPFATPVSAGTTPWVGSGGAFGGGASTSKGTR